MSGRNKNVLQDVDISLLRPPIELSGGGIPQIIQTMNVGTPEMKELLLNQCDIIFECKVCKNLFRSLANFIAHKRAYCQDLFQDSRLHFVESKQEEQTTMVFPKPPPPPVNTKPWDDYIDTDEEIEKEEKNKGLSVFEQMQAGTFKGKSDSYKFYTSAVDRQQKKTESSKTSTLTLESISGSNQAVFQTIETNGEKVIRIEPTQPRGRGRPRKKRIVDDEDARSDTSKSSQPSQTITVKTGKEVENVLVVEPKPATTHHVRMNLRDRKSQTMAEKLKERDDCDTKSLQCLKCNIMYSSIKSLHHHMTSLHSEKRMFYPCLFCSAVFAQVWSVTRHLTTAHSKTRQETRNLVDDIRAGGFEKSVEEIGEYINPRSQQHTAKRGKDDSKPTGKADLGSACLMHRCKECGKIFGKKESHDNHVKVCTGEIKAKRGRPPKSAKVNAASAKDDPEDEENKEDDPEPEMSATSSQKEVPSSAVTARADLGISEEELQRVLAIVDETSCTCLKCYRMFGTISNLHRHAIRHLGWRRFKCKFCKFMCYNRSECRRHLRVVHHKTVSKDSQIDKFIDKLQPEALSSQKVALPRVEMKVQNKTAVNEPMRTRGGIYEKATSKPETVLVTRSGMYRKPTFAELTGGKRPRDDSDSGDNSMEEDENEPDKKGLDKAEMRADSMDISSDENEAVSDVEEPRIEQDEEPRLDFDMEKDFEELEQRRKMTPSSRNKRKGFTPCKSPTGNIPVGTSSNTPATALPASHFLKGSPVKSPAKVGGLQTMSPKSPMANILSKGGSGGSSPRFTLQKVLNTGSNLNMPVAQLVQLSSQPGSVSPRYTLVDSSMKPLALGVGKPGIQGSSSVKQLLFQCTSTATSTITSSLSSSVASPQQVQAFTVTSLPTGTTIAGSTTAQAMPILKPVQPVQQSPSMQAWVNKPPVLKPNPISIEITSSTNLNSTGQNASSMPVLSPMITTQATTNVESSAGPSSTGVSAAALLDQPKAPASNPVVPTIIKVQRVMKTGRSLTPQPVHLSSGSTSPAKPRSLTPGPGQVASMDSLNIKPANIATAIKVIEQQGANLQNPKISIVKKPLSACQSPSSSTDSEIMEALGKNDVEPSSISPDAIVQEQHVSVQNVGLIVDVAQSSIIDTTGKDTTVLGANPVDNIMIGNEASQLSDFTKEMFLANESITQHVIEDASAQFEHFVSSSDLQDESNGILIQDGDFQMTAAKEDMEISTSNQFMVSVQEDSEHNVTATETMDTIAPGPDLLQMIDTNQVQSDPMQYINKENVG